MKNLKIMRFSGHLPCVYYTINVEQFLILQFLIFKSTKAYETADRFFKN